MTIWDYTSQDYMHLQGVGEAKVLDRSHLVSMEGVLRSDVHTG